MRTLTLDEVGFVSGGDDEPMQEVVVNGRRMSPEDIQNMMDFLKRHTQMDGGGRFAGDGGGGEVLDEVVIEAARDGDEAIDNTPGYPVEHQKGLGISDYQEAWQKVLSKMSAAELTAFSGALAKVAADAKEMKEKGASYRLAQLAAAVLVGDSIGAAFASNQASDNLRGKSMALFEGLITKAYAAAAALPGGI